MTKEGIYALPNVVLIEGPFEIIDGVTIIVHIRRFYTLESMKEEFQKYTTVYVKRDSIERDDYGYCVRCKTIN